MLLLLSAAFAAGCADDKEEGGNDIKLNPDPTQLSNITLMKATFAADEFNMISEPGFELFPDEAIDYRSLWYFEGAYKQLVRCLLAVDCTQKGQGLHLLLLRTGFVGRNERLYGRPAGRRPDL